MLPILRHTLRFRLCQLPKHYSTEAAPAGGEEVLVEQLDGERKGVFVLSLNYPKAKNALSKKLVSLWFQRLDELNRNKDVRVLILRSLVAGVFCGGADLKERIKTPLSEVESVVNSLRLLTKTIYNFEWPTICALDGIAVGGGLEMGLSCDLRIAATNAKMGLVETKLAIIPGAGGTQTLSRIVGPSIAKELIFTGRILGGVEAREYGIVNHVVEQNDKGNAAFEKAVDIATEMLSQAPKALRMAKFAINRGIEVDLNTALDVERLCYAQLIPTSDRIEGLQAFLTKRKPKYTGE